MCIVVIIVVVNIIKLPKSFECKKLFILVSLFLFWTFKWVHTLSLEGIQSLLRFLYIDDEIVLLIVLMKIKKYDY